MILVTKQEVIQDITNMKCYITMTSVKFVTSHKLQKYVLKACPPWFKIMCVNAWRWSKYDQNIQQTLLKCKKVVLSEGNL